MSSTNKTTNLLLSQFLGTDHFSFLTDYNGDMLKIDTYCGNLKSLIDGQSSKTEGNTESIQNIQSDIQSIQSIQENQNKNITGNTEDIKNLKSGLSWSNKLIEKNANDIKELQKGKGEKVVLETSTVEWKMGDITPKFYYDPNTKNIVVTSNDAYFIQATSGLRPTGTLKVDATKIADEEILSRLQKGSPIVINCGWMSSKAQITIDGTIETFPTSSPVSLRLYGTTGSNTLTAVFNVIESAPTGALRTGEGTIMVNGVIPMGVYI